MHQTVVSIMAQLLVVNLLEMDVLRRLRLELLSLFHCSIAFSKVQLTVKPRKSASTTVISQLGESMLKPTRAIVL